MRSLTEISVSVYIEEGTEWFHDRDHAEITVESPCPADEREAFGWPTTQEIIDGAAYVAGILGRLAFLAIEPMRETCARHCNDNQYGCRIKGTDETMLDPSFNIGGPPAVYLLVPTTEVDAWVERVRGWLAVLVNPTRVEDEAPQPLRAIAGGAR